MSGLTELLARCEAATGPDREIDAAIAATFRIHWTGADHWINRSPELEFRPMAPGGWRDGWLEIWMPGETSPRDKWKALEYTASIDAALALVERLLPGAWYVMAKGRMSAKEPLFGCELLFNHDEQLSIADGPTQSLAILAALLRALISRTPATGGKP